MDFFIERLAADPNLHIYHYAPYEPTALKRLMGRYGTREDEVDHLLRRGVLVDLLRAVRQSLRASVESYSIKRMEPFYGFEREIDLRDAGSSIVAFEQWLELGEGERPAADHLERIERYNRDDVVSNLRLRDWLEARRDELADADRAAPSRGRRRARPQLPPELTEAQARVQALVDRLAPTRRRSRPIAAERGAGAARALAARPAPRLAPPRGQGDVVGVPPPHGPDAGAARRRGSRPIGLLEPVGALDEVPSKGKQTWRYRYPGPGARPRAAADSTTRRKKQADPDGKPVRRGRSATLVAVDPAPSARSTSSVQVDGAASARASCRSPWVRTREHQARLFELGEWVADHGIDGDGPHRAARDLLLGRPPRVGQAAGDAARPARRDGRSTRRAASPCELDETVLADPGAAGLGQDLHRARG